MSIKTVLFDLDGTLLPMDQDVFVGAYFKGLVKRIAPLGYDPDGLVKAIWTGTKYMIKNNGEQTNEVVFWNAFAEIFGEEVRKDEKEFERFYIEDFDKVKEVCGKEEMASKIIESLKEKGIRVVLATNPIFPRIATEKRIKWAGLNADDFELITTYENCSYCKPNVKYYEDILNYLGVTAEECLMVGNDVDDDMVAENLGMKVFLLTDNLINKSQTDISQFNSGGYKELEEYINSVI